MAAAVGDSMAAAAVDSTAATEATAAITEVVSAI